MVKQKTNTLNILVLIGTVLLFFVEGNAQFTANGKQISTPGQSLNICVNTSVSFVSTVTGAISWDLESASPNAGAGAQIKAVYNSPGRFVAEQIISLPDTVIKRAVVINVSNVFPVANFFVTSPTSLCASENFSFTNTSIGNGLSFKWFFGDCAADNDKTSTAIHPILSFGNAIGNGMTSCRTSLIVTNNAGCADTSIQDISVNQFPSVNMADSVGGSFLYDNKNVFKSCGATNPKEFVFFNTSSTSDNNKYYTITWENDTNTFSSPTWPIEGIRHTFREGFTKINVNVAGQNGCTSGKVFYAFVSTTLSPKADVKATYPEVFCAPLDIAFQIEDSLNPSGTSYKLAINDLNASIAQHPAPAFMFKKFTYTSCGIESTDGINTYQNALQASLTTENPCGSNKAYIIPIYVSEKASSIIGGASNICANNTLNLSNKGRYGSVIELANGLATCKDTGRQVWQISPSTYTVKSGSLGNVNGNYSDIQSWSTGSNDLEVDFKANGTYTIKHYIGNDGCGIDSSEKTICVRDPLIAGFTLNARQGCGGTTTIKATNKSPASGTSVCDQAFFKWVITPINNPDCESGQYYQFTNGSSDTSRNIDIIFDSKGLYEIKLISNVGLLSSCATESVDTIVIYDKPDAHIVPIDEVCANNPFIPEASNISCKSIGDETYTWRFENGSPSTFSGAVPDDIRFLKPGISYMTLTISNICGLSSDTVYTQVLESPIVNDINDTTICSDYPTQLSLASNFGPNTLFTWTSTVIAGSVTGNSNAVGAKVQSIADKLANTGKQTAVVEYKIVAQLLTQSKCPSDSTIVLVTVLPRVDAGLDTNTCLGKNIQLRAIGTGITNWDWQPAESLSNPAIASPSTTSALTSTTMFSVTGVTASGCRSTDSVLVQVSQPFDLTVSPKESYLCIGESLRLQAKGGAFSYSWIPSETLDDPNIATPLANPSETITYTVTAKDEFDCFVKTDNVHIVVGGYPTVELGNGSLVLAGTQVPLFAGASDSIKSYRWLAQPLNGAVLDCQNAGLCSRQLATIYSNVTIGVEVENIYGCKQTDTISFQANCIQEKQLFVPTAFTPDGNYNNDVFTIRGGGFIIRYLRIYNRWGNLVFERKNTQPNDKLQGWTGKMKDGSLAQTGVYTVIAELECTAGGKFPYKGNLTLIR